MRFFLIFLAFFSFTCFGQSRSQLKKVDRLFKNRTELHFLFLLKDKNDQKELTRRISIDHVRGDTVWAFANRRGMLGFFELGYTKFKILETPSEQYKKETKKKKKGHSSVSAFDTYPTYSQYEQAMQQFATDFPAICQLVNLGTLPSGRKILALKITDSVGKREPEPQFFYTSSMHGDETAGYPLMLKLADLLLTGYGQNPRITQMVNSIEIWINPLANPDGTYRSGNNSVASATRFNSANIDLNRNYPDPEDGPHPDGNPYQPETKIFMAFADSMNFVMSANFHGGAEVANFPWDTWQRSHADEIWWTNESNRFADSARVNAPTNFFNQLFGYPNMPGVVQGFYWYEVNGGRQDYMNWFKNCRELTVELSNTKLIPENQILNHWNYYTQSLLNFMDACRYGLKGTVTDQCTGKPIRARIFIQNHDKDSSHVYSSPILGNFHRPIASGNYTVLVSAPGYQTETFTGISVVDYQTTALDVSLQPLAPIAQFSFEKPDLCSSVVQFHDLSGSGSEWLWDFGDGENSSQPNPQHSYNSPGPFSVSLTVTNCAGSNLVVGANPIQNRFTASPVLQGDTSICGAKVHTMKSLQGGNVEWFSAVLGGARLDSGASFITPPLTTTTTYFAQSINNLPIASVGPSNNSIGTGGFFTANTYHYLLFDCRKSCTLKSVMVFANTSGNRTIQLRNGQGVVLSSLVVSVPQGESRVNLNFQIPVGEALQLGINGGASNNLYRNNAGARYPYELDGLITINGNSAGNPGFYYYFYDWEIASRCESPRVPVTALVTNAPQPQITIQANHTTICFGDTVSFSSTATLAGTNPQYSWRANNVEVGTGTSFSIHTLTDGTIIQCQITSQDSCAVNNPTQSNPITIQVKTLPPAPILSFNGQVLRSSVGNGIQWFLNGNLLVGLMADSLLPTQSGTYWVRVLGSSGCFSLNSDSILVSENLTRHFTQLPTIERIDGGFRSINPKNESLEYAVFDVLGKILVSGLANPGVMDVILPQMAVGKYTIRLGAHHFSFVANH